MSRLITRIIGCCALAMALLCGIGVANACSTNACVMAGPRLASVDSTRGALLNALLGNLTGSSVNLTVLDWNAIAQIDVSLFKTLNALQISTSTSTPNAALAANATVAQILSAAATAATSDGNPTLAIALNNAASQFTLLPSTIKLGDLVQTTNTVGTASINALDLLSGVVQLYNKKNVLTTPTAINVSGGAIGLSGVINSVDLYAQVVEPPVYVCGPTGTSFYSAAIRIKLSLDLVNLSPNVSSLLGGSILGVTISVGHLDLYVDVAHASGTIGTIDAIANALTVQITPGVANIYIGSIADGIFFDRTHTLAVADVGYGTIGSLSLNVLSIGLVNVGIQVRSYANGAAPSATSLTFNGPYSQTKTAYTGAGFVANLLSDVISHTSINLTGTGPIGGLVAALLNGVKPIITAALNPVLSTLLNSLANPLLELLGIRLGEIDVTSGGAFYACSVAGNCYNDANHSGLRELSENGSGLTLYAKLVQSGAVSQIATIDPTSGAYSFTNATAGSYTIIIDNNTTVSDVAATLPAGWIGTEVPTMSRALTIASTDITSQNFGIYNGSKLSGAVFGDTGVGSGTANDAIQNGTEAGIAGIVVKVTDNAGTTSYDTTTSGASGTYTLWIPASAGALALKVTEMGGASISVGGNAGNTGGTYARATDTTTFTHVIGSLYTGVTFADVPANAFDTDGQQTLMPGQVAFYRHAYTSGTGGSVTFAMTSPGTTGWSQLIYLDANCNGIVDSGETVITSAMALTAAQKVCLVVKVTSPANSEFDVRYPLTVGASFSYANNALTNAQNRTDLTITGNAANAGLILTKSVNKATAKTGDVITYTITYTNNSAASLTALKIYDSTPAYTIFSTAACGTLATGLSACNLTTAPAIGATGHVEWQFTGSLSPAATGTVTFAVTLQ